MPSNSSFARQFLRQQLQRVDRSLLPLWYKSVSIPTSRLLAEYRRKGWAFADPSANQWPELHDLDRTAEKVIERSVANSSLFSGAAGLAGAASIPPEMLATVVATLRLSQRLAVVYGFDPETDRGQMALCRALARAYDVQLPATGPANLRLSDMPRLLLPAVSPSTGLEPSAGPLVRAMFKTGAIRLVGRVTRFVPVITATFNAAEARRAMTQVGLEMQLVFQRLAEVPLSERGQIDEALVLK